MKKQNDLVQRPIEGEFIKIHKDIQSTASYAGASDVPVTVR